LDPSLAGRRTREWDDANTNPGADAASRAKRIDGSHPSKQALEAEQANIDAISAREKGSGRRVSEIKLELGQAMDKHVAVFRDEAGIQKALETVRRLKEEAESAYIDDRGSVFNQDILGAIELGYMLDNAECTCIGALERKESRGAVPHRLPGAKRRGVAEAHRPPAQRRRAGDLILRGDDHPVGAGSEDLLDGRVHAQSP
jgi:Succinate dehydrogenase/fumarate reductase, flavoprotein subunit